MNKLKARTGQYYTEVLWLLIHIGLGMLFSFAKPLAKLYVPIILALGFIFIFKSRNKNHEVLMVCAYMAGADVFMRMTSGLFFSELMKYIIIVYMVLGIVYNNISKPAFLYIVYILLLIPGIYMSGINILNYEAEFRKVIAFNLSGPVCTGVCAIYCINKTVSYQELSRILYWFLLPIVSMTSYMALYKSDLSSLFLNTTSNFGASGGYGPNQVSVALGVGIFILLYRFLLCSEKIWLKAINAALMGYMIYRGLLTFSRGGILTAAAAIVPFLGFLYLSLGDKLKKSLFKTLGVLSLLLLIVWGYSNIVSNGLLEKRYNNQDALGREKEDALGGREELIAYELEAFNENPFLGIGVGNNKFYREDESGIEAASHNEITRLLAEHGMLGFLAFSILFITPLARFWFYHRNPLALSFFIFWFLTINHNATRISVPTFLYALSVITLYNDNSKKESTVHREQAIGEG
ncbi:O-antigen ligase family protein [Neptunitalea lumnitzerae]|uniref:Ligase n=1 Tax=Neptunitalea lumnitzerae TaxID=2965509 RepID=A0ABQ5MN64_9FLAO|nr:O-antigen ligase family protein [Neptunitalea sp. Y10]GLB50852.1 ligase [Neptunitalea sp. Y10]